MIPRRAKSTILDGLSRHAGVVLLGPRQVGKTTLALQVADIEASTYLDLERPSDAAKMTEPELFLTNLRDRLVVLDEVQRAPGLFSILRGEIDRRRRAGERTGQFLLLGSASRDLLNQSAESLAGRVVYLELFPLDLLEVGEVNVTRLWVRGGFPEAYLAPDDRTSIEWRQAFIRTYLERDIPAVGPRISPDTFRRFWTMLAHSQGGLLNATRLAAGLGLSGQTVARYIDVLIELMLVRRLESWSDNVGKRLTRSPKIYLRDSGVMHALLGLQTYESLLGHPAVGGSWEGFVIENLMAVAPAGTTAWFYRTSAGAEIDLILALPDGSTRWAIEIKRSVAPKASRGFQIACDDVGAHRRMIVAPVDERYSISDGINVVPLQVAMNDLLELGLVP